MSISPNLNLTLTDESDNTKKFLQWRNEISGTGFDSNFMILDEIVANIRNNKADKNPNSVPGNLAIFDAEGNPVDCGTALSEVDEALDEIIKSQEDIIASKIVFTISGTKFIAERGMTWRDFGIVYSPPYFSIGRDNYVNYQGEYVTIVDYDTGEWTFVYADDYIIDGMNYVGN